MPVNACYFHILFMPWLAILLSRVLGTIAPVLSVAVGWQWTDLHGLKNLGAEQ